MENLNNDDKLIMKKLLRNEKERIRYSNASKAGCNKKLINKQEPSKRGRKAKHIDILLIDEPKEPTEAEKLFETVRQQNRKQKYKQLSIKINKSE